MRASRAHCHVVIVRNFVEALAGIADAPVLFSCRGYSRGLYWVLQKYSRVLTGCSRRTHAVLMIYSRRTCGVLTGYSRGTHGVLTRTIRSGPDRAHPLVFIWGRPCVCTYVYMEVCLWVYLYMHICVYISVCMRGYAVLFGHSGTHDVYEDIYMIGSIYVCVYVCVYECVYVCACCMHENMRLHIHRHMCMHAHRTCTQISLHLCHSRTYVHTYTFASIFVRLHASMPIYSFTRMSYIHSHRCSRIYTCTCNLAAEYPESTRRVPAEYPESTRRVPAEYPQSTP